MKISTCVALIGVSLVVPCEAQEWGGPSVAVKHATGSSPALPNKGFAPMLIADLTVTYPKACKGRTIEWIRRDDLIKELDLQHSRYGDPSTRAPRGQLVQPDYFVETVLSGDASRFAYEVKVVDATTNEVVATESDSVPADRMVEAMDRLAKVLPEKLCKLVPGYALSGRMDDASINGKVCGKLDRPFTATSPEVAGSWQFTPKNATSGSFTYTAKNIGGVPGSGKGTYVIAKGKDGSAHIRLSGTGAVHSPLGTFSAAITESIRLTPLITCGRVGYK